MRWSAWFLLTGISLHLNVHKDTQARECPFPSPVHSHLVLFPLQRADCPLYLDTRPCMDNVAYLMPHGSSDPHADAAGKRMYHLESGLHTDGQPWHSMAQRDARGVLSAVLVYRY